MVVVVECRKFDIEILGILMGYCMVRNRLVCVCLLMFIVSMFVLLRVMVFDVMWYLGWFVMV